MTTADGEPTTATRVSPLLGLAGLEELAGDVVGFCGPDGCAPEPDAGTDASV